MTERVIFKYKLTTMRNQTLRMAPGRILSAQTQNNQITIWVLASEHLAEVPREFRVMPTGHTFEPTEEGGGGQWDYLGTVQLDWTVWHLFEVFPF